MFILWNTTRERKKSKKKECPGWGSNSRPSDYETDALPTALPRRVRAQEKKFLKSVFSLFSFRMHEKERFRDERMKKKVDMRRPGIEPGSTAWKAAMLTTIPPTLSWETGTEDWKKIEWKRSTDTIRMGKDVRILSFQVDVISFKWKNWQGNEMGKSHCRDQDSNLGYCGHNAGS